MQINIVEPDLNAARRTGGRRRETFSRSETVRRRDASCSLGVSPIHWQRVARFGSLFGFRFLGGSNGDLEALLFVVTQIALIVVLCSAVLLLLLLLWRDAA